MACIILHCPLFCGRPQGFRYPLGGTFVVGRKRHAHMAVIEDRVVGAVSPLDLVERLGDQKRLDPVTRHER